MTVITASEAYEAILEHHERLGEEGAQQPLHRADRATVVRRRGQHARPVIEHLPQFSVTGHERSP